MSTSAKNRTKHFSFLIILAACLLSLLSCQENDITKVKALFQETDADVEVADSVKFIYKEGPYSRAIVTGKTVKRYTNSKNRLEFTDGLLVKFYEQLTLISVMKADYAESNDDEQIVKIKGNVYIENAKYEILETEELIWNMRNKKIVTDKPIKIKTIDNTIYGVGFDADEDFSNYTIRKVTGIVAVDDAQGFK